MEVRIDTGGYSERTLREVRGWSFEMMDGALVAGAFLVREGRDDDAKVVRDFLVALDTHYHAGHVLAGVIAERERSWGAAHVAYGKALAALPDHLAALAGRARAAVQLGRHAEARVDYEAAARVDRAAETAAGREARLYLCVAATGSL